MQRRPSTTRHLWLSAVAIFGAAALSATPAPPTADAPAPGAAPAAALPSPPAELSQLAYFAGNWSCKGQVEATPFGPQHPTQSKVSIRKEYGGFWNVGTYKEAKSATNPSPMSFEFIMGYDSAAKAFTMDGFDTFGSRSHQKASGWQDNKIVFDGESVGNGTTTPARDTFTKKSASTLEHLGEIQVNGNWTKIDQETCKRLSK
ncbi:MAG TPA: DUF1579 family protein [Thermoanaerobaculia bacterium]|nr:DUF1579 family protein [Thermoanaerobaculia bacterium]